MNIKSQDIIEACKSSTDLEINEDKKQVRRINNKALPEKSAKKREIKAQSKTQEVKKVEEEAEDVPV